MKEPISFSIQKKLHDSLGRAGILETPHGVIETPAFVAVGTKATIKGVTPEMLRELGSQVTLANTYHLYLQPGDDLVRDAGGLHTFMNWNGPLMTDSGGFQVFSLGAAYGKEISKVVATTDALLLLNDRSDDLETMKLASVGEEGVSFKSHIDGSMHYFTPDKSIEIQHNLGADIIFAFDECTSPVENERYQTESLDRTHRWAQKSLNYHQSKENRETQALFGVIQGGRNEMLRKKSADVIANMVAENGHGFDGFGIGGSFAKEDMSTAVKWVNEILPEDKPRHLLGIGEPEDLFMGVENGVDLFDCVAPTRMGRNGTLYTKAGKINLMNTSFQTDFGPIDVGCGCYACTHYTRAYVAHLFRAKEMLAGTLASIHNLYFLVHLVADMRTAMLEDRFFEFKKEFLEMYTNN